MATERHGFQRARFPPPWGPVPFNRDRTDWGLGCILLSPLISSLVSQSWSRLLFWVLQVTYTSFDARGYWAERSPQVVSASRCRCC